MKMYNANPNEKLIDHGTRELCSKLLFFVVFFFQHAAGYHGTSQTRSLKSHPMIHSIPKINQYELPGPDDGKNRPSYATTVLYQHSTKQDDRESKSQQHARKLLQTEKLESTDFTPSISSPWKSSYYGDSMLSTSSTLALQSMQDFFSKSLQSSSLLVANVLAAMYIMCGTIYQTLIESSKAVIHNTKTLTKSHWYTLPMSLCFAPLIHQITMQKSIATPEFWKMVNMDYILHSTDASVVINFFIGSNAAYLLAGIYLLYKFPPIINTKKTFDDKTNGEIRVSPIDFRQKESGLGLWVLSAGLISTIFHTVQAVGDNSMAEALCYVDHGIAGTAILYFWKVLGKPPATFKFWSLAISGLVTLSLPLKPGYAFLHSTWHFLSAGAALVWAMDNVSIQKKCKLLLHTRIRRQQQKLKQSVQNEQQQLSPPLFHQQTETPFSLSS